MDKVTKPYKLLLFTLTLLTSILIPLNAHPHPGGTDSKGCHTCRTNCERWGISYGFYHRHYPVRSCQERARGTETKPSKKDYAHCIVVRVIDGDTFVCKFKGTKEEKIRLIGVDTPETKHPRKPVEYFGKEASAFTKRMVEGKRVKLGYDWQRKDRYGRTLAYVYLEDGTFLNAEIIKEGYGFAYTKYPFKYLDEFRELQKEARLNKRGLWGN